MEYFTEEAMHWDGPPGRAKAVFDAYKAHLARLWPHLSPEMQALTEIDLQDGLLRQIVLDRRAATTILRLRCGCFQTFEGVPAGYFDLDIRYRQIALTPAGVEQLQEAARDRRTEVLYDELDREPEGVFVHRLLCDGEERSHEMTIRFHTLELVRTPREQRHGRLGWPRRRFLEIPAARIAR